jgi:hypothetical protein
MMLGATCCEVMFYSATKDATLDKIANKYACPLRTGAPFNDCASTIARVNRALRLQQSGFKLQQNSKKSKFTERLSVY